MYDFHDTTPIRTYPPMPNCEVPPPNGRHIPVRIVTSRRRDFALGMLCGVCMTVMVALASWPVVVWWLS